MKRFLLITICFLSLAVPVFSQESWEKADAGTKAILGEADAMIRSGKYLSAYHFLREQTPNDFILAKQADIMLDYFVQSIMHQMFALTDLKEGESIMDFRGSKGSFPMAAFNPPEVFREYEGKNGVSGILELMLGKYYYEICRNYYDRWLEPVDDIIRKSLSHYGTAFSMGYGSIESYSNYAELNLNIGEFKTSIEYYKKILGLVQDNGTYYYNLAYTYLLDQDFENAGVQVLKAIELYRDYPERLGDAYLMAADINMELGNFDTAFAYIDRFGEMDPGSYYILKKRNLLYLKMNDGAAAELEAKKLFSLNPRDPEMSRALLDNYYAAGKAADIIPVFRNLAGDYPGDDEALGNIYFHLSTVEYDSGDADTALQSIDKARTYFSKVFPPDHQVFGVIDELSAQYQK